VKTYIWSFMFLNPFINNKFVKKYLVMGSIKMFTELYILSTTLYYTKLITQQLYKIKRSEIDINYINLSNGIDKII
jgi:hypothetical protein